MPVPASALAVAFALMPTTSAAPLHERIDQLIAAGHPDYEKQAAPLAPDAEFLRRVYLDLTGTIPTAAEARAFLADRSPGKRAKLIDRLLTSPGYARRMAQHFDVVFMERRKDEKVPRDVWMAYLRASFAANKPYDQLAREILSADGVGAEGRGPAKFYLDRNLEPTLVTRDIGRVFLGRDLQCAQCHDHPKIDDYKQAHFHGILAFLNRSYLFPNAADPNAVIAEKAEPGDVTFVSVFDRTKTQKTTGPRLPDGEPAAEPKLAKGKEYKVKPTKNVRPVPTFSRRQLLAKLLTAPDDPAFARTAANRLWALMLGRGLVQPLDLDHSGNPPSHPELLDLLAEEFVAHKHDVRWLLREIALSKTYQRSSVAPAGLTEVPADRYLVAALKPLSPEQLAFAVLQATGQTDAERRGRKDPAAVVFDAKLPPRAVPAVGDLFRYAAEATLDAKLVARAAPFRKTFGGAPGEPEDPEAATLDQALFLKHGGAIRGMIAPRPGDLTDRLGKLSDPRAVVDELFLSVLSRPPTNAERSDVAAVLSSDKAALPEVVWALIASAEFRFNH
ncbi:MAG TPA: DUF1549 and DUF1553 domain-containing protein [Fimbriiglobus sp.]|nr:DUF1549 and DUF1553 domain-containing protein [Fimbriiglobus sp.]